MRIIKHKFYNKDDTYMSREYKIEMILRKIEQIHAFSDILIDILYGLLC